MEVGPRIFALRPKDRHITELLRALRAQACCFSTGRTLFFAYPMPLDVLDLLSPDELRQLFQHIEGTLFLHHTDKFDYWREVLNRILLRLQSLGCHRPEKLPLQLVKDLRGYPLQEKIAATRWINAGMQGPPPPDVDMEAILYYPGIGFLLPDGHSIIFDPLRQTVCEAMLEHNSGSYWTRWIDCITKGIPILVDENSGKRYTNPGLSPSMACYIWKHNGTIRGGGRFVRLNDGTYSGSNSYNSQSEHLQDNFEGSEKGGKSPFELQRRGIAGPSKKPLTRDEQRAGQMRHRKKESRNVVISRSEMSTQNIDVNQMHPPSRVSHAQVNRAFGDLHQDSHPAQRQDGGQILPKRAHGNTKDKRIADLLNDERPCFVRLPHNKLERFPSSAVVDPVYIEFLETGPNPVYRGEYCHHLKCLLPDDMIGWSQYPGDYSICPRRFDPELHEVLNPRSVCGLTPRAFEHFQVAHQNKEVVLLYDFPTIGTSLVDKVEMPASLVHFVETLTAFEAQQILIGKLDIDWISNRGRFLLSSCYLTLQYALWRDMDAATPRRVSEYDASGKLPLETSNKSGTGSQIPQKVQNSQVQDHIDLVGFEWPTAKFGSSRTTRNPQPIAPRHSTVKIHPTATRRSTARPASYSPPRSTARDVKPLRQPRPQSTSPHSMHQTNMPWHSNGRKHAESFQSLHQKAGVYDWFYID